jgi:hypothetical protein
MLTDTRVPPVLWAKSEPSVAGVPIYSNVFGSQSFVMTNPELPKMMKSNPKRLRG